MKKQLRRVLAFLLAAVMALLCFGCGRQEDQPVESTVDYGTLPETVSDGKFTLNYSKDASMNPYTTDNQLNLIVGQLVYETLTVVDETYTAQPMLLTAWESADGEHWTFTVDTERKFHDGHMLTAEDVAYSINSARDSALYGARLRHIVSVESGEEAGTVSVTLAKANMQLPALLNIPAIESDAIYNTYPAGTGPYTFSGSGTSLTVFEGHPDAEALPVDTIYLNEYKTMEDIVTAFDNGELDLVVNDPTGEVDLSFSSVSETRQFSTTNLQYLGFNTNSRFFQRSEYRTAISTAIDRAYAVSLMSDAGVASALPVHPLSPLYDESLASSMEYDLKAAADALTTAKVVDYDGDGEREFLIADTEVNDISLSFLVCSDSTQKLAVATKIAGDLESIGLPVVLKAVPFEEYKAMLQSGNFDMYYGEVRLGADFDLSPLLGVGGSMNFGGVTNGAYADAINAYLAAGDDTRGSACDEMLQVVADNAPLLPICFEKHEVCAHRGTVGGFSPTQYNIFNQFTNWVIDLK